MSESSTIDSWDDAGSDPTDEELGYEMEALEELKTSTPDGRPGVMWVRPRNMGDDDAYLTVPNSMLEDRADWR